MQLPPHTRQISLQDIHGIDIPFIWAQVRGWVDVPEHSPTVLVVGSAVELEDRAVPLVPTETLRGQCESIADILVRHGMNMVTDSCPGIPNLVEKAYVKRPGRGVALDLSILRCPDEPDTQRAYSPSGFPSEGDVVVYCGSGFEVLSILNSHCADLVLVVGGGLGSLMEGIIAVVNDLPVICYSPSGGISGEMQSLFERYRSRYKTLCITTCSTTGELDSSFGAFANDFRRRGVVSRLTAFLSRLQPGTGNDACPHTDITIESDLDHVTYQFGQSSVRVQSPVLLIDDAMILKEASAGAAIRSLLDSAPREYHYDGVTTRIPAGVPNLVWCPSIDTFLLIAAMRRHARKHSHSALDVGTGTGMIALWLAASGMATNATGIDVQPEATRCAAVNAAEAGLADRCKIRTSRYQEFWKEGGRFDLIACNPPYMPVLGAEDKEDGSFFGLNLIIELLGSIDRVLAPAGECFITLSSATWMDPTVRGLMQDLIDDGRAAMIEERMVPFKLAAVLVDAPWLEMLVLAGGVFALEGRDEYAYWHRVQIWRLESTRAEMAGLAAGALICDGIHAQLNDAAKDTSKHGKETSQ